MKSYRRTAFIFISAILLLSLTNPDTDQYHNRIMEDFGQFHGGQTLSKDAFMQMGHGERESLLAFSTYTYRFGNIAVKYWGIAGQVFYVKSFNDQEETVKETNDISV